MITEVSLLDRASNAREQLKTAFPGQVTGPDDLEYEGEVCRSWYVGCHLPQVKVFSCLPFSTRT